MQESKKLYVRIITALLLITLVFNTALIFSKYRVNDGGVSKAFLIQEEGRFGMAGFPALSVLFGVLFFAGFGGGLRIENNGSGYKFESLYKKSICPVKSGIYNGLNNVRGLSGLYVGRLYSLKVRTGLETMLINMLEQDGMK